MPELDLNLLRVFDALMDTESVTAAALRLHLSAPATSRALARLRSAMNDPILVRAGQTMVPTPFARQAAPTVKALILGAQQHRHRSGNDPSDWQRTLSIRINDGLAPVLAPELSRRAAAEAPGVRLRFTAQDNKEPDLLRDGTIDLDVGVAIKTPPDIVSSPLLVDRFVAVTSAHSALGQKKNITPEDLVSHPHISASRRGLARGPLDEALEARGLYRSVTAVVPSYAVGAMMALQDDVICLLPELMTTYLITRGVPLRQHNIPFELPQVHVEQRWHRRVDHDDASRWLRGLVDTVAHEQSRS